MSAALKSGIIIVYLLAIIIAAILLGRGTKTYKDYAIGGGKLPWYILGGTIFSTFVGGATMVAYVGNFFVDGMIWIWVPVICLVVGIMYYFISPRIYNIKVMSIGDILLARYGIETKTVGALLIMLWEFILTASMIVAFAAMASTFIGLNSDLAMVIAVVSFALGSQHFFGQFAKPLLKGARFPSASATVWG